MNERRSEGKAASHPSCWGHKIISPHFDCFGNDRFKKSSSVMCNPITNNYKHRVPTGVSTESAAGRRLLHHGTNSWHGVWLCNVVGMTVASIAATYSYRYSAVLLQCSMVRNKTNCTLAVLGSCLLNVWRIKLLFHLLVVWPLHFHTLSPI